MSGLKYWNGNRWVGGSAAWVHAISENGGWVLHHQKMFDEITREVTINRVNEELARNNLRRIK